MDRELKRQMKQDDLVSGVEQATSWVKQNQDKVRLWGLVALVVVGGGLAFQTFSANRRAQSQAALAEALDVLARPVASEQAAGAPLPPGVPSFATSREKQTKAVALLDGVASRYGSLPAGKQAAYLAAVGRLEMGELDAARQALTALAAERGDKLISSQARLGLAELEARAGQVDKAAQALRELADDAEAGLPRDYALLRLGLVLEQAQRGAEAAEAFRRLARDFPASGYVAEAQRRADYLQPQSRS